MKNSILLCLALAGALFGTNPIITTMYTADPSGHVWADGRFWLYPSHDRNDAQWWDMTDWHVFSSDDLVTWTDHGACLSLSDIPFAKSAAWAPDCAYRNGTYYFYFPVSSVSSNSNTDRIGVATSSNPYGPFTVVPTPLVSGEGAFDPCVFIDDDGQAYLYCGQNTAYVGKLKPSMTELDGPLQPIGGADGFFEGIWLHKRNGIYYLSYSMNGNIGYGMGTSPLGPFVYKGIVLTWTGTTTIHSSIVEYRGDWLMFYHNQALAGGNMFKRSVCADYLHYNSDGTMRQVVQTKAGIVAQPVPSRSRIRPNIRSKQSSTRKKDILRHASAHVTVFNICGTVVRKQSAEPQSATNLHSIPPGRYCVRVEERNRHDDAPVPVSPR